MTVGQNRSLRTVFNVGVFFAQDPGYLRSLRTPLNIGVEVLAVLSRGLRTPLNVGVEVLAVLSRGLRNVLSATVRTGIDDPVEFRLWNAALTSVIAILRGK